MLTRESDYAFRIVDMLGCRSEDAGTVSVRDIADQTLIPYRFARKIIAELTRAGVLSSERGRFGGVRLAAKRPRLNAYQIISLIDPKTLTLNRCLSDPDSCERIGYCRVHVKLKKAQHEYEKLLRKIYI